MSGHASGQRANDMVAPLEHPAIKWLLIIIVFIASFHAAWKALEYINRVPNPVPRLDYEREEPELAPQKSPAILVVDRSLRFPLKGARL